MKQKIEQVLFDQSVEPLDPAKVHQLKLANGRMMPAAAFGTFHSDWIKSNLEAATQDLLSEAQLIRLCGDGTAETPGIDADNRLIWGQVFLWPEADGDWRILWDDSQVFETREGYAKFKASWEAHHKIQKETTYS